MTKLLEKSQSFLNKNRGLEIWKEIEGTDGAYLVSTKSRIKSVKREITYLRGGKFFKKMVGGCILKKVFDSDGYQVVTVSINGKAKLQKVHRIIANAFIPNPKNKSEVNHINGKKSDNRIENLEWTTRKENSHHAIKVGLFRCIGETNYNAKLTEIDIYAILSLSRSGASDEYIAEEFGVQKPAIYKIRTGRHWSHITGL